MIAFTIFKDKTGTHQVAHSAAWSDIANTVREAKPSRSKDQSPLLKLASFGTAKTTNGCYRTDENMLCIGGIEGDYDSGAVTLEAAKDMLERHGVQAILYTSWSHTPDRPRWRVLCPTSKPLPPHDRKRLVARLNGALGGILAPESFTLSQAYFYGRNRAAEYQFAATFDDPDEGSCIDLLDDLDRVAQGRTRAGSNGKARAWVPGAVTIDAQMKLDLRSALNSIPADDRELWVRIGLALKPLGDAGRGLWLDWSQHSDKYDPADTGRTWESFDPKNIDFRSVFAEAKRRGWINPLSGTVQTHSSRADVAPPLVEDGAACDHLHGSAWPPLMIPAATIAPEIPADLLPGWAGAMVDAVSKVTQTPSAAAVLPALSVLAAAVQRRFEVAPRGVEHRYREPLCIWSLGVLPSGARKSAINDALMWPLKDWEKLLRERMRREIAQNIAVIGGAKKRIERLQHSIARAKSTEARKEHEDELRNEIEAMPTELRAPRLYTGDVTPERLQSLLVEHNEAMSVFSDEPGIFAVMGGAYSGGALMLDVFLQSYSGMSVRVDRAGRVAHLDRPALTFGLLLQNDVLKDVAGNPRFRGSGLLARFLFALPQSLVGHRDVREQNVIPPDVERGYHDGIMDLLHDAEKPAQSPRALPFTNEARELWLDFAEMVEGGLLPGGRFEGISDWGAKLPGQCARIAGVMQMVMTGRESTTVGRDAMLRAVRLAALLIEHAHAAFRLLGADSKESDALYFLRWIEARGELQFDRAVAHKALEARFRQVDTLKAAAARLAQWGVLSAEMRRRNDRARPTPYYEVNPGLFDKSRDSQ
jgi:hypothetical protein